MNCEGILDSTDPVDTMVVFQKNLEMINAAGKRLHDCEKQRQQAKDPHAVAIAASALAAEKARHQTACVDLRKLATKMGNEYQQAEHGKCAGCFPQG